MKLATPVEVSKKQLPGRLRASEGAATTSVQPSAFWDLSKANTATTEQPQLAAPHATLLDHTTQPTNTLKIAGGYDIRNSATLDTLLNAALLDAKQLSISKGLAGKQFSLSFNMSSTLPPPQAPLKR
jgi:hypothetical protein